MADARQQPNVAQRSDAPKDSPRIALLSTTGRPRMRGTYVIPSDKVLVLEVNSIRPVDLAAIEADGSILKVRSDTPVTPDNEIERYDPNA